MPAPEPQGKGDNQRGQNGAEEEFALDMQDVAEQLVLMPIKQELSEYARFCSALQSARR